MWKGIFECWKFEETHYNSVHDGHKHHKCNACGKSFSEGGTLKRHLNSVHNSQKNPLKMQEDRSLPKEDVISVKSTILPEQSYIPVTSTTSNEHKIEDVSNENITEDSIETEIHVRNKQRSGSSS